MLIEVNMKASIEYHLQEFFRQKARSFLRAERKIHLAQEGEGLMLTLISICLFVQLNSLFKHSHSIAEE